MGYVPIENLPVAGKLRVVLNLMQLLRSGPSIFISLIVIFLLTTKYTFGKYSEFFYRIQAAEKSNNFYQKFENIKYFAHYETAISIFKNNPILGVGNKNFRHECGQKEYFRKNIKFTESRCSTHPHQIHFEILSLYSDNFHL